MDLLAECSGKTLANGLKWVNEPREWRAGDEGLVVSPESVCDLFRPYDRPPSDNCSFLYKEVTGDFTAATRVSAELADFADGAALVVRGDADRWAKICLERSPIGDISIVSVVTDPWSDDANGEIVTSKECSLRLTRKDRVLAMHYSLDGVKWRFVRMFPLELPSTVKVGIHAQAPFSTGCRVVFRSLTIFPETVDDFRSGN